MNLESHRGATEVELDSKSPDAFRTISEVADDLDIPQHVLRFWETRFPQIKPLKRGGGRRYYRPDDVALLKGIRRLLYGEGYTIKGLQRILKEQGPRHVQAIGRGAAVAAAPTPGAADGILPPVREPDSAADEVAERLFDTAAERELLQAALTELAECRRALGLLLRPPGETG